MNFIPLRELAILHSPGEELIRARNFRYGEAAAELARNIDREIIHNVQQLGHVQQLAQGEAGYIYVPYIPMMVTPPVVHGVEFQPNMAIMSRYATRMVNADNYTTINIANAAMPAGINFNININNIPVLTSEGLQFFPVKQMSLPRERKGISLEVLRELRAATIEKWQALGLLDNLAGVTVEEAQ